MSLNFVICYRNWDRFQVCSIKKREMNYEELEQLFYAGELELCIKEGSEYLLDNPRDTDALFLMAVAHHDKAYEEGEEEAYEAIKQYVIPYLKRVLQYEPNNPRVLYNILNYPLGNQFALQQRGISRKHLTADNKDSYLEYAERLKLDPINKIYGHDFQIKIYEVFNEQEDLLRSLDEAIAYFKEEFKDSRDLRDRNISICWMKKIYVLDQLSSEDRSELIQMIDAGIYHFISPNDLEYLDLAEIAFRGNALDVSLKVLLKLIKGDNHSQEVIEAFVKWHRRFHEQIELGYHHPDVFYFQLIIERNYAEELGLPDDFYYHHGLEVRDKHPDNFAAYHFVGTYLYEMGDFDEAFTVLSKGVAINSDATTWRRMVESQFLSTGLIEQDVPPFTNLPRDIFNEGVNLDDFLRNMLDDSIKESLRVLDAKIYQQSFDAFRKYFEENKYESDFYGDEHCWAMCCNNLCIVYTALERFDDAIRIAKEGMEHSDFSELHHSLIHALLLKQDYEEAQHALENYFELYDEKTAPFYRHLQHRADWVKVSHELGNSEDIVKEAEELLFHIYEHYQENPDISDYDFRDFEAAKNTVETVLYKQQEHKAAEHRIKYYIGISEKYPDESNPQFNLMQAYNELEDYENVNKSARLYLENKQAFLLNAFDKAKTIYMIVKSHYLVGQYREGAALFTEYNSFSSESLEPSEYVLWLSYGIKLYDKLDDLQQVNALVDRFQEIYTQEEWVYDSLSEDVLLAKAHVNYVQGYLKEAHRILDYILSYDDHNPMAEHFKQSWKKPGLLSKLGF